MQSERRRIENIFKHLWWSLLVQTVNSLKSLTDTQKHSTLDVWSGFDEYASAEK